MQMPSDAASPMNRLEILKLELAAYESRGFTDKHPDIVKTREEITRAPAVDRPERRRGGGNRCVEPIGPADRGAGAPLHAAARLGPGGDRPPRAASRRHHGPDLEHAGGGGAARRAEPRVRAPLQHVPGLHARNTEAGIQAQLERRQLGEQFRVIEAAFEAPEPSAPEPAADPAPRLRVRGDDRRRRRRAARGARHLSARRAAAPDAPPAAGARDDPAHLARVRSAAPAARPAAGRARHRRRRRVRTGRRGRQLRLGERVAAVLVAARSEEEAETPAPAPKAAPAAAAPAKAPAEAPAPAAEG